MLALATTWVFLAPRWETNDDPGMMMLAHGFGLAAEPTPQLVYSNVLWGHVVQAVPSLGSITGYAVATAACLLVVGWTITFALTRQLPGLGGVITASLLCAVCLTRAFTAWQFTVTAGLLMVSSVAMALLALRHTSLPCRVALWCAACALAMLSSMIRLQEAALVALVALPIFASREYLRRPEVLVASATVLALVLCSYLYDRAAYRGVEWNSFWEFEPVRWAITDFQAGARLRDAPEVMARHSIYPDEVAMLERWGFVTPELTDSRRWAAALKEIGATEHREGALAGAVASVQALARPGLLWLTVCAVGMTLIRPSWRILVCWVVFIGMISLLGALGRPGVERVYVPPLVLLALTPLLQATNGTKGRDPLWRTASSVAILSIVTLLYLPDLLSRARANDASFKAYARAIASAGEEDIITWGFRFPYQLAYPPLGPIPSIRTKHLSLGGFTYVPSTNSAIQERAGNGVLQRLRAPRGALVAADTFELNLLNRYLSLRFGEVAVSEPVVDFPGLKISRWKVSPIPSGSEERP